LTENDIKKEYLKEYKKKYLKLKSLEEQLESLRETNEAAKVQTLSDMPHGSNQSDLSDYMVRLDNTLSKIIKLKQECLDMRLEIENRIADIPDGIESEILHKKYIEFKSWETICVEIGYEWAQTHRKHSDALKHFNYDME
jgi:hypothetical protein